MFKCLYKPLKLSKIQINIKVVYTCIYNISIHCRYTAVYACSVCKPHESICGFAFVVFIVYLCVFRYPSVKVHLYISFVTNWHYKYERPNKKDY